MERVCSSALQFSYLKTTCLLCKLQFQDIASFTTDPWNSLGNSLLLLWGEGNSKAAASTSAGWVCSEAECCSCGTPVSGVQGMPDLCREKILGRGNCEVTCTSLVNVPPGLRDLKILRIDRLGFLLWTDAWCSLTAAWEAMPNKTLCVDSSVSKLFLLNYKQHDSWFHLLAAYPHSLTASAVLVSLSLLLWLGNGIFPAYISASISGKWWGLLSINRVQKVLSTLLL